MSQIHDAIIKAMAEHLQYDEQAGLFTRRIASGGRRVGAPAGAIRKDGYMHVALCGKTYLAHRLAWALVHGDWPQHQIDHIDGNRLNNAISNLRDVSPTTNQQNRRRAYKTSTTGLLGASLDRARGKFVARIKVGNRNLTLGRFDTAQEAHEAYLSAKRKFHAGSTV